ncbi:MAG: hypothetical protein ABSA34_00315 [Candidatus Goldiibacteriota bacterium]|jgi:hypothetical protein
MKKMLIILGSFFFAAGMVIGYLREIKLVHKPDISETITSLIFGGIIYFISGAGLCLIFGLPLYIMWKKKKEKEDAGE